MRVGVVGAAGRMGSEVCRAVDADPGTELVARIDLGDPLTGLVEAGAEVVVDFTVVTAARSTLAFLADNAVHAVVGTTGFTDDDLAELAGAFTRSNCLIAPNVAVGAVLMMRFAELAAPYFETAEVIELHHDAKVDAPSGTALMTLRRMAEASSDWSADPTRSEVVAGARGGRGPGDIPVHSVRLRGLVAHQEVLLGTQGQVLSIRHDSIDRTSVMPGVLLAVKRVAELRGLTVGLDDVLGI
ncbi:MAG: 4-hydroxy-tetrahydrodipicolinate reductase [Acidimicrobiales bacterium]